MGSSVMFMQYKIFRTLGNPNAELNKHRKKNLEDIIKKHGQATKLERELQVGEIIELDTVPETLLIEDLSGDYFELAGV